MLLYRPSSPLSSLNSWIKLEVSDSDSDDADLADNEDNNDDENNNYEAYWSSFESLPPNVHQGKSIYPSHYVYKPRPFLHYADDPFSRTHCIDPLQFVCMLL